jgi:leader peptidase (prepilin peptidase)/N-methyltransferase
LTYGLHIESILAFAFFLALLIIFFTDLNEYIIPNIITYSLSILGIIAAQFSISVFNISLIESLLGGLISGSILLLTSKIYLLVRKKEGMGMGDVKMIAMIGFWMGLENTFLVLIASSLLGSIIGIGLIQLKKIETTQYIPFGTFLSLGSIIVWLQGILLNINLFAI